MLHAGYFLTKSSRPPGIGFVTENAHGALGKSFVQFAQKMSQKSTLVSLSRCLKRVELCQAFEQGTKPVPSHTGGSCSGVSGLGFDFLSHMARHTTAPVCEGHLRITLSLFSDILSTCNVQAQYLVRACFFH